MPSGGPGDAVSCGEGEQVGVWGCGGVFEVEEEVEWRGGGKRLGG